MNNTIWSDIARLFEEALQQSEPEAWLKVNCKRETKTYREVRAMLKAHATAGNFLGNSVIEFRPEQLNTMVSEGNSILQIKKLGPYNILKELGTGGMGTVYLAEHSDKHIDRQVALKVLRPGFDQENIVQRFVQEQRMLSTLEHPGIARLYDAGVTEDGRPYFAMEYINGLPIDTYCDENELSLEQCLHLFINVCEAVQYAHRNLIVHRDLKPSNVLVDENNTPKLLDFGIAKLLIAEQDITAPLTRTGQRWMTPEYAAPEQVRAESISTATDVYALGALLYKLLTGSPPFRFEVNTSGEIERVICEEVPTLPSAATTQLNNTGELNKKLKGDLDTIILKALRKEPERRYTSVESFSNDIKRYLDGLPVKARRDTVGYRTMKFVNRHRIAIITAAAIVLLISSFGIFYTLQITQERDRAEQYASFLTDLFSSPDPFQTTENAGGKDITVREYMDKAAKRVQSELTEDPEMQIELLKTIAGVQQNLGHTVEASLLYHDLLAKEKKVYGERTAEAIETMRKLAWTTEDYTIADSLYRWQIKLGRELEDGIGPLTAHSMGSYGSFLFKQGKFKDALKQLEPAVIVFRTAGPEYRQELANALMMSGNVYSTLNKLNQADTLMQEAYSIQKQLNGVNHPKTANFMNSIAMVAQKLGDYDRAEDLKRRAFKIFQKKLGMQHPYTITLLSNIASIVSLKGDNREASKILRRVHALRKAKYGENHIKTMKTLQSLASNLMLYGELDEAEPILRKVYVFFKQNLPPKHYHIAFPLLSLTGIYLKLQDYEKAENTARGAVEQLKKSLPDDHVFVAVAESRLGAALAGQKRYEEAVPLIIQSCETLKTAQGADSYRKKVCGRLELLADFRKQ